MGDAETKMIVLKRIKSTFLLLLSMLAMNTLRASEPGVSVSMKIDTTLIRIGEQFGMNLSITTPAGTKVLFPVLPDTLKKLEIVQRTTVDTVKTGDAASTTLQQHFTITSFDSGFYVIEPISFFFIPKGKTDSDSIATEAQLITVRTIQVDTTHAIRDIKATLDVPFTWKEALPYIIGLLVLVALTILVIREIKRRKKKPVVVKIQKPTRPAHEIALEALKKTEAEKLWQQGLYKQYHSNVSEIIRMYIEHRFSIQALEYTSDETLEHFRGNLITNEAKEKLSYILRLADLVKFAKVQPVGSENDQSMRNAYDFIELTKPVAADDLKPKEVNT